MMKKIVSILICCVTTASVAYNCPDSGTITVSNHVISAPADYIIAPTTPIPAEGGINFRRGMLVTQVIDNTRVNLNSIYCTYKVGDEDNTGFFELRKHFLSITTTDQALIANGWSAHNNRKWFDCVGNNNNLCMY